MVADTKTEVVKAGEKAGDVPGVHDVWAALRVAAPEVVEAVHRAAVRTNSPKYDDYPGFKPWLLTEFALATPTRVITDILEQTRADMITDGSQTPWPKLNDRQLITARRDLEPHWRPLRSQLESQIRDIGVVNKNRRLLALQQMAEAIGADMYTERDEKNGRLYLLPEYRATLRAIAEEVGELGVQVDQRDTTIRGLVDMLSKALDISGMGVQAPTKEPDTAPYDYRRPVVDTAFVVTDEALNA